MGGADIIPGVSGGTVALILGIYERLVQAISRFDWVFFGHVSKLELRQAARHVDLHFLYSLGLGVALGIGGLATLMHYLLENQMQFTFAAFTGLILASSVLVARMVSRWDLISSVMLPLGAVFAFYLVGLPLLTAPPDGPLYIFFCGAVGICAMILPGISGAFILLILGKYLEITGLLKDMIHFKFSVDSLTTIAVFCAGMVVGLISFSKLLRWLLARYEGPTMALLCGFMLGSLRKLWPFKVDLTPSEAKFKLKQFENIWPQAFDSRFWMTMLLMGIAAALVLGLDRATRGSEHHAHFSPDDENSEL